MKPAIIAAQIAQPQKVLLTNVGRRPLAFGLFYILKLSCNFGYFIWQVSKISSYSCSNTMVHTGQTLNCRLLSTQVLDYSNPNTVLKSQFEVSKLELVFFIHNLDCQSPVLACRHCWKSSPLRGTVSWPLKGSEWNEAKPKPKSKKGKQKTKHRKYLFCKVRLWELQ